MQAKSSKSVVLSPLSPTGSPGGPGPRQHSDEFSPILSPLRTSSMKSILSPASQSRRGSSSIVSPYGSADPAVTANNLGSVALQRDPSLERLQPVTSVVPKSDATFQTKVNERLFRQYVLPKLEEAQYQQNQLLSSIRDNGEGGAQESEGTTSNNSPLGTSKPPAPLRRTSNANGPPPMGYLERKRSSKAFQKYVITSGEKDRSNVEGGGGGVEPSSSFSVNSAPLLEILHQTAANMAQTTLSLPYVTFTEDTFVLLASIIRSHPSLETLDLEGCSFAPRFVPKLLEAIVASRSLKEVSLRDTPTISPEVAARIAEVIRSNHEERTRAHHHQREERRKSKQLERNEKDRKDHARQRKELDIFEHDEREAIEAEAHHSYRTLQRLFDKKPIAASPSKSKAKKDTSTSSTKHPNPTNTNNNGRRESATTTSSSSQGKADGPRDERTESAPVADQSKKNEQSSRVGEMQDEELTPFEELESREQAKRTRILQHRLTEMKQDFENVAEPTARFSIMDEENLEFCEFLTWWRMLLKNAN